MFIEMAILFAIATVKIAAAIYVVYLVFSEIADWFQSNRKLAANDRREIGFTLQKQLANGDYNTVQGVFNKSTKSLGKVRAINSARIDDRLAGYHKNKKLVVYS
jgi:hypothetical protein